MKDDFDADYRAAKRYTEKQVWREPTEEEREKMDAIAVTTCRHCGGKAILQEAASKTSPSYTVRCLKCGSWYHSTLPPGFKIPRKEKDEH